MDVMKTSGKAKAVIVIVHGAGEHSGRYGWLIRKWNEHGYHVVIGDLPGQGKTTGLRGYIRSFDDYIETVMRWIKEAKRFQLPLVLLGHSMGGLVIIRTLMTKSLPVQAVILSSPCLGLVQYPPKWLEALSKALNFIWPKLQVQANHPPGSGTRNEEIKAKDALDPLYNRKITVRWYRELRRAMKLAHEQADAFPNIPLLILQGGDDRIVNKRDVKRWYDRLQIDAKIYKEWHGLFHEVFNEPEREEVFSHALQFVQTHASSGKE